MTCKELVELVTDYLEGELNAGDKMRFERHLSTCAGCATYLEQMRQAIRMMGHMHTEALTEQQWQDLLTLFEDWKNS
jgi:anti-sigma factor RsiW